jgi:hypothetical protein
MAEVEAQMLAAGARLTNKAGRLPFGLDRHQEFPYRDVVDSFIEIW